MADSRGNRLITAKWFWEDYEYRLATVYHWLPDISNEGTYLDAQKFDAMMGSRFSLFIQSYHNLAHFSMKGKWSDWNSN